MGVPRNELWFHEVWGARNWPDCDDIVPAVWGLESVKFNILFPMKSRFEVMELVRAKLRVKHDSLSTEDTCYWWVGQQ